jgi:hypothetical protein
VIRGFVINLDPTTMPSQTAQRRRPAPFTPFGAVERTRELG